MKKLLIIVMILIGFIALNKPSYALKIFDILILDKEFYENNQDVLPPKESRLRLEYPAWLIYEKNKVDFNANYNGIINIKNGNWSGTKSYNFSNRIFFVYNTKKKLGFFKENTFAFYGLYEQFSANILNPKYDLNINYKTNLFNQKIAWGSKLFKYVGIGASLGYYNNEILPHDSLLDYGVDINFQPEFWKYTKNTTIGFHRTTDYFSAQMLSYLFIKDWDFLKLKWLSEYVKRKNEFYFIRVFNLDNHKFISQTSYSLKSPEEFRTSLDYNWNSKIEISLLANTRIDIEKGPVSLVDYQIPNEYELFANHVSGFIDIQYKNEKYGIKTAGNLTKKNKIGVSFLRDVFEIKTSGKSQAQIEFVTIEPFRFSQNLKVIQDQIQIFYLYQSSKWRVNPSLKHISFYNKGGEITYWAVFQKEESQSIKLETLRMVATSLDLTRHFKKFDVALNIEQYIPLPNKKHKSENTSAEESLNNNFLLPQSIHKKTTKFIKDNLFKTGFIASINFIYYF